MSIPIALHHCVRYEAERGLGWEDCCVVLKVPRHLWDEVRDMVLGIGHEHQRESTRRNGTLPKLRP